MVQFLYEKKKYRKVPPNWRVYPISLRQHKMLKCSFKNCEGEVCALSYLETGLQQALGVELLEISYHLVHGLEKWCRVWR